MRHMLAADVPCLRTIRRPLSFSKSVSERSANHELREFVRQTLPILREHLAMAQKMETTLAGT